MRNADNDTSLPAPLSLTLDQAREVAGGSVISTATLSPWYRYGQPAVLSALINPISMFNPISISNVASSTIAAR